MEPEVGGQLGSDAELITRVRVGDTAAFGELYRRHVGASTALARQVSRSSAEADDLVSESFARVLDGLKAGGGPDTAFRAYLFTTLRHTAYDRTRKDGRLKFTDDMEAHETPVDAPDPVIAMAENGMVGKAFANLPERWQAVLWHTQVEGMSPAETGVLLGMSANAVTSLAFRAREGLREAYLQAHLAETAQEQCRWTTDRLGAWARGGLSKREQATVDAHLESCDHCAALAAELTEINSSLRSILAPLLLGGLAAGYLAALGPVGALAQAGAMFGTGSALGTASAGPTIAAAGAAGGAHAAGASGWFTRPWAVVGTGLAAAAVAAVVAVIIATSGGSSPTNFPDVGGSTTVSSNGTAGAGSGGTGGSAGSAGTDASGSVSNGSDVAGSSSNGSGSNGSGTNGSAGNGSQASNGNPTTEGVTGTQGGGGQQSTTGPAGSANQPGIGGGTGYDGDSPPDEGGQSTSEPNDIPPPVVPSTQRNAQSSTEQATSGSPQRHTSAPTTRTTSPTVGTSTTRAPTSSPTSRATTPTRTTTTTARPPTTTPSATAPNVSISVGAFSAPAGGSITVQVDADNTAGTAASTGGTVVVNAPGVTLGGSATGLRAGTAPAFAPAVAIANCSVAVAATSCSLPAVAAGQLLHTSFILRIGLDAQPGSLVVSWGNAFSKTVEFGIMAGITGITVTDGNGKTPEPLQVGDPTSITLTPALAEGVSDVGPITLPARSGGIWVTTYPDTCTRSAGLLICQPSAGDSLPTYGPFAITVMPDVIAEDALEVEVPDGSAPIAIIGGDASTRVAAPDPNGLVHLAGHFRAITVTAATLACSSSESTDRGSCGMDPVDAAQTVMVPSTATVVWARLTWAAGTLEDPSSVPDLYIDGSIRPDALDGGTAIPCPGSCPVVSYRDVTRYLTNGGKIQVKGIGAVRKKIDGRPLPLEGWTLTVAYTDPGSNVFIEYRNGLTSSNSARGGTVTELAPAGDPLVSLDAVGWAVDPVAHKTVVTLVGDGKPATALINGLDGISPCSGAAASTCTLSGVQPIQVPAKMLPDDQTRAIGLVNTQVDNSIDALWIGTTVVVRSVSGSQPAPE